MNQILFHVDETHIIDSNLNTVPNKKKILYGSLFLLSLFSLFFVIFNFSFSSYSNRKNELEARKVANKIQLSSIYSNHSRQNNIASNLSDQFGDLPVIGTISVPIIDVYYPILSHTTDDLLKLSPCRFYGPMPNQIGNMCIVGHNYDNNKFFSNIKNLKHNDEIIILDTNNQSVSYYVYSSMEVSDNDSSPVLQKADNKREITLITCNNKTKKRIIVKAKEY